LFDAFPRSIEPDELEQVIIVSAAYKVTAW
jgi:hypothetical protein